MQSGAVQDKREWGGGVREDGRLAALETGEKEENPTRKGKLLQADVKVEAPWI